MGVTTFQARCQLASNYISLSQVGQGFWVGLGKLSPWLDEDRPPYPALTTNRIPEVFGFWYVHSCVAVYADTSGHIQTKFGNYSNVSNADAQFLASAKANKVYMEALIGADFPTSQRYRAIGLCTQIHFISPPPALGAGVFVPAANVDYYFLDWITTLKAQRSNVVQLLREF